MTVLKEKKMLFMKDFNSGRLPAAKANCAITADIFFVVSIVLVLQIFWLLVF